MRYFLTFLIVFFITIDKLELYAQDEKTEFNLNEVFNNNEELEALALYPNDIRAAILELSTHPELIVKLGLIQEKSQEAFQEIISTETEEVQKNLWELLRYPGLVEDLVEGGPKSKIELKDITASYPEEINDISMEIGVGQYDKLVSINQIDQEVNHTLEVLLKQYDADTEEKVKLLLMFPEVLHIIVDNLDAAVLVGNEYQRNPALVLSQLEDMKLEVAQKHQKDIDDWKKGLEEDPQALVEFEEASQSFRSEEEIYENYDPLYPYALTPEEEQNKEIEKTEDVNIEYNYYPYPYWYGYPVWFPNVYWYRYPYWYHWGYYYGPEQSIVILGLPSYYYFYWYFNFPTHYYRYPHLSNYIIRYYRSRISRSSTSNSLDRSVEHWRTSSRSRIPNSILQEDNDRIRIEKIREYGRFEQDYQRRIERKPNRVVTREQFLNQNSNRYRYLSGQTRIIKDNETNRTIRTQTTIRSSSPIRSNTFNRARDIHQRTWQRSIPSRSGASIPSSRSRSTSTKRGRDN